MMQNSLARTLRVLRAERGWTLREASSHVGVTKETLSDLERGLRHPHDPTLAKIAKGYGVPVGDLLEEPALKEQMAGAAAPLAEAPKEPGRSTRDVEIGELLENLRHVTTHYEGYRRIEAHIDEYREAWEKRLAEGKFEKVAVEEAGQAIRAFWPAVTASAEAEIRDLVERVGLELEEAAATSVQWAAMRRFMALGEKINRAYHEEFQSTDHEDLQSNVIELFPQQMAS